MQLNSSSDKVSLHVHSFCALVIIFGGFSFFDKQFDRECTTYVFNSNMDDDCLTKQLTGNSLLLNYYVNCFR